ncbi:auxin-responsive protein SAUR68-like [Tripterygium wilfordii]|uniref:auxin-responsive protein SAUR68-like n=1 Tax=Tripterygium wilfordii TaxID=458696 RepID=UPI0018F80B83|nr:auxin-responsive protein SAUR68-like [Tripterygium wilfordii]
MISTKKLIRLARKWQKFVAIRRKRITFPRTKEAIDVQSCSTSSSSTTKGHFVVYTADQIRFVLPLQILNHGIIRELFRLAEEEFGLSSDGPLTLPCDASFMEYVIALIQQHITEDVQKALLISISNRRCSSSSYVHEEEINQQMICSF